jgi:hypothetical protein
LAVNPERVVPNGTPLWMLKKGVFDMWAEEENVCFPLPFLLQIGGTLSPTL